MFKPVFLFIATNVLVIATISAITSALGLHSYLTAYGIDYKQLALFCAIWGTGGAFISLFLSKFIARMAMGVVIIHPDKAMREERVLLDMIYTLAKKAGLKKMPDVGIYRSPEVNAFATGPSRNNALVAVSSGLLTHMNRSEMEAVLGHEISHVANGDMVTLTLIRGVVNAFAMFLSRIIAYAISMSRGNNDGEEGGGEFSWLTFTLLTFVFDILFTLLGQVLVSAFSRWREYRADAGGATLAGRDNMIAALTRLQQSTDIVDERAPSLSALKISQQPSWLELFSTHPPLAKRIARLQAMKS